MGQEERLAHCWRKCADTCRPGHVTGLEQTMQSEGVAGSFSVENAVENQGTQTLTHPLARGLGSNFVS